MKPLSIIVAYDRHKLIGAKNKLPWYLPADLKRFKELSTGNAIIMGHATHQSIGRPLPNRRNIVLSRQAGLKIEGCEVVGSLREALALMPAEEEAFVIGGAQIYTLALPFATKLYVTEVDAEIEGDTYFPEFKLTEWKEVWREENSKDKANPYDYNFVNYAKA